MNPFRLPKVSYNFVETTPPGADPKEFKVERQDGIPVQIKMRWEDGQPYCLACSTSMTVTSQVCQHAKALHDYMVHLGVPVKSNWKVKTGPPGKQRKR